MERRADTPWQNDVNTVASMVQALLLKNEFCDVVFQVGTDGETEQIKSHRALLAARSSVFATMFFGSVPENKAFVEVTDTSPDIFKLMLKFVYSDDTAGINVRNLIDMYGVAHKYDIIPLKKFCADQVKNCISMETVGEFLEMNDIYDVAVIRQHCNNFIEANAWKLFQKEEYFVDLPQKHLMYIWQYDTFPEGTNKLPEIEIFRGAITWAKAECERQGLHPDDPKNQRQVLGPAVDLICFPRMSLSEFHEVATKDGLLTWEEFSQMTLYMVNAKDARLAIGRPAPKTNSAVKTGDRECVRLSDGRLIEIQRGLLQDAIAGK
ncbi:hypothetical protein RvY_13800-2 [Ramazzottius varieornatus]|nr:hypothetical protein RvY_13800-2 [Ramazzottius varieornatus]